ncbi:MAG TPA: type II toxin-antitoxin system VapC family toxin [Ktedonobacteraceae bacterium]|nr:type II toxin-antitoxin system VapC family toxin [Ktedonobacteraceae bacterium]
MPEQGHRWITALCDAAQPHELYIAQPALVEVVAALCRREREGNITRAERDTLITFFREDSKESYDIWPVTTDLYTSAADLCRSHRLRAYDAVQLACTLALREYVQAHHVSSELVFASADVGLLNIASAVGLRVENPNDNP